MKADTVETSVASSGSGIFSMAIGKNFMLVSALKSSRMGCWRWNSLMQASWYRIEVQYW